VETISFEEAMQRFIGDAPCNFARFRRANREPGEPVITKFDCAFAVEGASDVCIGLLDYDVPRARIDVYEGHDEAAAHIVFESYGARLREFAADPVRRDETTQHHDGITRHWRWMVHHTPGQVGINVTQFTQLPHDSEPAEYVVWVEVDGFEIECIQGRPEDSPWHILFAGTSLQAPVRPDPKGKPVRKARARRIDRRRRDGG
jgi:hypothetical protein